MSTAAELVASKRFVLLDFDGPICSVFGGVSAAWVAAELQRRLGLTAEHSVETRDPFDILKLAAAEGEREAEAAERELARLEVEAVASAIPTDGADSVMHRLTEAGHTLAVVSNNSAAAVSAYLYDHDLDDYVRVISARNDSDPALLKPNPHLLLRAMEQMGAKAEECVMVGDSVTDIKAAGQAGIQAVAYANKPWKTDTLFEAKPAHLVRTVSELREHDHPKRQA